MPKLCSYQRGITFFEMLLMLLILTSMLVVITRQVSVWKTGKIPAQPLALIQQNIATLRQAANAYYFANCQEIIKGPKSIKFKCEGDMPAVGGLSLEQCKKAMINPWGQDFDVNIWTQRADGSIHPSVLIFTNFASYPGGITPEIADRLARILQPTTYYRDSAGLSIWQYAMSRAVVNQGMWYRVPGNYNAVSTTTAIAGTPMTPGLWIMNAGLNLWAVRQAESMKDDKPTLCPQND
jgi:hypothetical protein